MTNFKWNQIVLTRNIKSFIITILSQATALILFVVVVLLYFLFLFLSMYGIKTFILWQRFCRFIKTHCCGYRTKLLKLTTSRCKSKTWKLSKFEYSCFGCFEDLFMFLSSFSSAARIFVPVFFSCWGVRRRALPFHYVLHFTLEQVWWRD